MAADLAMALPYKIEKPSMPTSTSTSYTAVSVSWRPCSERRRHLPVHAPKAVRGPALAALLLAALFYPVVALLHLLLPPAHWECLLNSELNHEYVVEKWAYSRGIVLIGHVCRCGLVLQYVAHGKVKPLTTCTDDGRSMYCM